MIVVQKHPLSCRQYAFRCHLRFRQQLASQFFTKLYLTHLFTYLPDATFFFVTGGVVCNSLIVLNKIIFISNQMVFRFGSNYFCFESRIVSNYVLNCSRANIIVRRKASKPTILELIMDAGRDRLSIGLISHSLWSKSIYVCPSIKTGHRKAGRQIHNNSWPN